MQTEKGMGQAEDGMLAGTFFCMFILILMAALPGGRQTGPEGDIFIPLYGQGNLRGDSSHWKLYHRLEQYRRSSETNSEGKPDSSRRNR